MSDRSVCDAHGNPEPCAECDAEGRVERLAIQRGEKPCPICGAEVARLTARLKAADEVVSYLVLWGAAPTDELARLVTVRMEQRVRDKQTLCAPSAVRAAIAGSETNDMLDWNRLLAGDVRALDAEHQPVFDMVARLTKALAVEQGVAYTAIQHLRANGFPFDEALVRKHYEEAGR